LFQPESAAAADGSCADGFMFAGCLLEVSMARVLVGTSGWSYASWRGPFFPTGLPAKRQLECYASQFETVELNGVFYRTPTTEAVGRWRDETGRHFVFSWKASKFISHWKRLSENSINSLQLLEDRLSILGDKVGPILFQLPPDFAADAGRLGSFLTLLPEHRRYSFEFRHPSWYAPNILRMLAEDGLGKRQKAIPVRLRAWEPAGLTAVSASFRRPYRVEHDLRICWLCQGLCPSSRSLPDLGGCDELLLGAE
jgi:uncharacterized protein YecE (DUF72 family)